MSIEQDLERIALQEQRLQFEQFDAGTAWQVGARLREVALQNGQAVAIEIIVNGHTLFACAMPGTTPDNLDWIRRKRNVVQRFQRCSYAVGLALKQQNTSLAERYAADPKDYAASGGGFPIRLRGSSCVGSIIVSGLPQRSDHNLVVRVLTEHLGVPLEEVALGAD